MNTWHAMAKLKGRLVSVVEIVQANGLGIASPDRAET